MDEIVFRQYRLGDESKIVDLFIIGAPHKRTMGFWEWINKYGPFGQSIVEVGELDGKIVATYAVMPVQVQFRNELVKAGFGIQLFIHNEHRNINNTILIADRVYKRCEKEGLNFVYGFPNDYAFPLHSKVMGWEHIADFRCMELYTQKIKSDSEYDRDIKIERVEIFNEEIDNLWQQTSIADPAKNAVIRNSSFLNWKFFNNPLEHYIANVAKINGEVAGYMVLKLFRKGNVFCGHLVDFLSRKQNEKLIFHSLLHRAFDFFGWAKVDVISAWCFPSNTYFEMLYSVGFRPTGFNTHFALKPIKNNYLADLVKYDNWFITMADSDAF